MRSIQLVSCMCMCVCRREMLTTCRRDQYSHSLSVPKKRHPWWKMKPNNKTKQESINLHFNFFSFNMPENIPFIGLSRRHKWQRRREIRCVCVTDRLHERKEPKLKTGEEMSKACWRRLPAAIKIKLVRVQSGSTEKDLRGGLRWRSPCGWQLAGNKSKRQTTPF